MVIEASICHIIRDKKLLLKKAARGISKGKWNALGGKIERHETPERNARREVFEETRLKVKDLHYHGTILYFMRGRKTLHTRAHLFSTRATIGRPRSTAEGQLKWFHFNRLPFDGMWDDDRYWVNLMLLGGRFDAKFYFDNKNLRVTKYEIISR